MVLIRLNTLLIYLNKSGYNGYHGDQKNHESVLSFGSHPTRAPGRGTQAGLRYLKIKEPWEKPGLHNKGFSIYRCQLFRITRKKNCYRNKISYS